MLLFHNLNRLSDHHNYLSAIFGQKHFFFVGGMIRDLLLNRETNMDDVDITLSGTHTENKNIITSYDKEFSFFDTEKYGTMTIIPKSEGNTTQYEITPFRTETTYSDGRHPDEVVRSDSLLDDSQRRDFTINCLYYYKTNAIVRDTNQQPTTDPKFLSLLDRQGRYYDETSQTLILQDHQLISNFQNNTLENNILSDAVHVILDPHGGIQDLVHKKIKAVGAPDRRFQEDALRVVRGLRFSVALECDFEKHTWTALQKNAHLIRHIAKERIKQECDKVFAGNNPFGFVALLDAANLLKWIFPKVYDNKGVEQPLRYHPFDVYTHTLMVLYHAQQLSTDKLLRYAALYHDVGKVEQYSSYNMKLDEEGVRSMFSSWLNHVICGEDFVREDFKNLNASTKEIDTIARYVRRHMKIGEILMGDESHYKKKLRPMIAQVGPDMVKNLCLLTVADRLGQYNPIQAPAVDDVYGLIDLIDIIMEEEGRFSMKELAINGDLLMKELKLTPGPQLGVLLKKSYERVLEDLSRNDKETLLTVIQGWMKE
ncbi:Multifunctional CCA protein [candidate division SR1 bacterium Aalborg_AAW-1]|nr:Multifunctional CCA protein [candidate division SR1 bacterium Aalborg_AAW-1]